MKRIVQKLTLPLMNIVFKAIFLSFICLTFCATRSYASHAAGGEISYKYLGEVTGGYQYEVTCKFYRFCNGIGAPVILPVSFSSNAGTFTTNFSQESGTGQVVTGECHDEGEHNHDNYCLEEYVYKQTVVLAAASNWRIGYSESARNANNTSTSGSLYVEATLDNLNFPPSSSVFFNTRPIGQLCDGQTFLYNPDAVLNGAGDRLEFEMIIPKNSATTNVIYSTGYSENEPFGPNSTFNLNANTGRFEITPNLLGSPASFTTIMAVQVKVYRGNQVVSTVIRDLQMNVSQCTNNTPTLSGFNGSSNYNVTLNLGVPVCFKFQANDADIGQYVHVHPASIDQLIGATYSYDDQLQEFELCWTPQTVGDFVFLLNVHDNFCPPGQSIYTYSISVEGVECPKECIPSFSPKRGEKYVLNAWVKESNVTSETYENAGVKIFFKGPDTDTTYYASGQIIDGWQRIEAEIKVPNNATAITLTLVNNGTGDVYFDDIRLHPFNSNMKSFVYDPITLRLMAEMDERNYATFYEYDEEGALTRVKKETVKGVKTIQESRNNSSRQ